MRSAISWALVVGLLGCAPGGEEPGRADINAVETAPERTARAIPVILDTDIGGDIDDTWVLFGGVQWKLKSVTPGINPILFGAEVASFNSDTDGGSEPDALQLILSAQYTF